MPQYSSLLILMLASVALLAGSVAVASEDAGYRVYRQVTPEGEVIFSDEPSPGADEIRISEPIIYRSPKTKSAVERPGEAQDGEERAAEVDDSAVIYEMLRIQSPQPDESVRANNGAVSISVVVEPALGSKHQIQYLLDGQPVLTGRSSRAVLPNLDRGSHGISAAVIGSDGAVLIRSEVVRFFVLRHSKLFQN